MTQTPLERLNYLGPYSLADGAWRKHAQTAPLVYRVRAWDPASDLPLPIARAGAVDNLGILDIGESGNGRRRLNDFIGAALGKPRSHRAGWEYSKNAYDFGAVFPLDTLRVEFIHVVSKEIAEAIELALLEDYRWRFKDRPPLNGSAGKYRKVATWLREVHGREPRTADGWLNLDGLLPSK